MDHVHARHEIEKRPRHVRCASRSRRRHVDLAWIGLRVGDEFGNDLGRNRWMHKNDHRDATDARDGRGIADEVEIELLVERRVYGVWEGGPKEASPFRGRLAARSWADVPAGPRRIPNHKDCPSRSESHWPINRAVISTPPPAANAATIRTGREG